MIGRPSRRRLRRRRWFVFAGALILSLALVAGWHYWVLYTSLKGAESHLLATRAAVADGGTSVSGQELRGAEDELMRARAEIDRARSHIKWDPLLQAAKPVPLVGAQVQGLEEIAGMAAVLTELGEEALVVGEEVVAARQDDGDNTDLTVRGVQLLEDIGPHLDQMDALVERLIERRVQLGDQGLVGPLANARDRMDQELPDLAEALSTAQTWQDVIPGLLGFEGERRYLVLPLNNAELLPGGGLVTASAILTVAEGEPGDADFVDSTRWKSTWESQGGEYIEPPGPLKRYLLRDYTWNLLVSNWSPDFPTWSRQALEFYELINGPQDVDGIVAVDLTALEQLLELVGPVTLEVDGKGEVRFNSENVVLELERLTRQPHEPGGDRKSVIGDLTEQVIARIQQLPGSELPGLLETVGQLGAERHIQAYAFDATEQAAFRDAGIDGAVDRSADDYVMLSEASVLGTKLGLILQRSAEHAIEVGPGPTVRHRLTLDIRNPLPQWSAGHDTELVDALMGSGLYGAYLRIFVPADAGDFGVRVNGEPAAFEDRGYDAGRAWAGIMVPIPAGQEAEVKFEWIVPRTGEEEEYELYIQKQPGMDQLCTQFSVAKDEAPAQASLAGRPIADEPICLRQDARLRVTP